jgi:hypothetical protein
MSSLLLACVIAYVDKHCHYSKAAKCYHCNLIDVIHWLLKNCGLKETINMLKLNKQLWTYHHKLCIRPTEMKENPHTLWKYLHTVSPQCDGTPLSWIQSPCCMPRVTSWSSPSRGFRRKMQCHWHPVGMVVGKGPTTMSPMIPDHTHLD